MTLIESGPGAEAVTLAEAKAQLRIAADDEYEADLIGALVTTASAWVQRHTGRSLTEAEWTLKLDCFPATIKLPMPPAATVDSVSYIDAGGEAQTLAPSAYRLFGAGGFDALVIPAWNTSWPATAEGEPDAVTIVFTAGYETTPTPIKQAILLLVSHWFENREDSTTIDTRRIPMGVDALLKDYRQQAF
jgi:uncharacterized phiE125 gp8 family phage protein